MRPWTWARASRLGWPIGRRRGVRTLEGLARSFEARDGHAYGHSQRVADHAVAIACELSLPSEQVERLRVAALLHDVGKVRTPASILAQRGQLTHEQYEIVKRHATIGAEMVARLGDPELAAIVRHHHERIDGGGYPDGLPGDRIPRGSRIIAVADTFDAVTSDRPYRSAISHDQAIALLAEQSGTQLDPEAVRAFFACAAAGSGDTPPTGA